MKLLLLPNMEKGNAASCLGQAVEILLGLGCTPMVEEAHRPLLTQTGVVFGTLDTLLAQCDILVTIGGDGTIIHATQYAVAADKPLVGINAGHLGFLAQIESNELERLLKRLRDKEYDIIERMLLDVQIMGGGRKVSAFAINDAVVTRREGANIVDLLVECGGKRVGHYRADGIIFATPTGSTGYAMSAGGPVIEEQLEAILLTPICSHGLFDRSVLFSSARVLTVHPGAYTEPEKVCVVIDGGAPIALCPHEYIQIQKATRKAKFISFGEKQFFEILSDKLQRRG